MRYDAISTLHYKRGGGNKKEGRHGPWMRSVVGTVVGMSFFECAVAIDSELNLTQSKSTHTHTVSTDQICNFWNPEAKFDIDP